MPTQNVLSPLEKGKHPEIETSLFLMQKGPPMDSYHEGFDVITAVITMSGFAFAPRQGHLDRLKTIYGYVSKIRHAILRVQTEELDYSDVSDRNTVGPALFMGSRKKSSPIMHQSSLP